ncbi:MAG: hypothetical protein AAGD32_16040 [Planctomycetota bacterium]
MIARTAALGLLLVLAVGLTVEDPSAPMRARVIEIANNYPDGGGYKWADTGVPHDIEHDGKTLLAKSESGTFCCGFTLAVAMRVGEEFGVFEGKSFDQMKQFQRDWYGVSAAVGDPLMSTAMTNLGVGGPVAVDDALPGDFLQYWRTGGSGHSVVFLAWVEDDGQRVGIRYRSSNGSTDGIGTTEERFAGHGGKVDPQQLYFARFAVKRNPD